MKKTLVLTALLSLGFASTALADEYYVVRNPDTQKCEVVTTKPTDKETITQIGPIQFKTKTEAEDKMKTVTICHDEGSSDDSGDSD